MQYTYSPASFELLPEQVEEKKREREIERLKISALRQKIEVENKLQKLKSDYLGTHSYYLKTDTDQIWRFDNDNGQTDILSKGHPEDVHIRQLNSL